MAHRHCFDRFELLPVERVLLDSGRPVTIGSRAFDMLLALIERRDRLVTKAELLDLVWPGLVVEEANLPVQVSALRRLLGPQVIATIPGRGYRFAVRLADAVAAPRPNATVSAAPAPATNLPASLPPLIGRDGDVAALDALLREQRLVTLVGPGGVGKSLLAQWLLYQRRGAHAQVVAWVDLSAIADASRVVSTVGAALRLNLGSADPLNALLGALQPLAILIALDNAEQLGAEVARLVDAVLAHAPGVRLLVTSQVPLKLAAEQVYRLAPLAVPSPANKDSDADDEAAARALQHGAVALFAVRAQAADSRFALTAHNLDAAVEICRRLDGLPLAIELAAARVPLFGVVRLASVLEERFAALGSGRRAAPARQQTLRAAMQWSHALLGEAEQLVFRRLGVFAGRFSLEAAQQVLADAGLDPWAVADALGSLIEHSLLGVDGDDPPRYRLLETPRAFALECLAAAGEEAALHARHAATYRAVFEQAYAGGLQPSGSMDDWRAQWLPEIDNARAAGEWAMRHDSETAVSLSATMAAVLGSEAPRDRGLLLTATRPLLNASMPLSVQAQWHLEAALDVAAAQTALGLVYAQHAVRQFAELGDRLGQYRALGIQLYCEPAQPADSQAGQIDELIALEDPRWSAVVRTQGANAAACWYSARGEFARAIEWRQRTLDLHQQAGATWRGLVAHANLMDTLLAAARIDEAIACGTALEARLRGTRQLAALPAARLNLAAAHLSLGNTNAARTLAQDGWPQALRLGWQPYWADYLALLAALEQRPRAAARLLGYAHAAYTVIATAREVNEARAADRSAALCRAQLAPATYEQLERDGARWADVDIAMLAFATDDAR